MKLDHTRFSGSFEISEIEQHTQKRWPSARSLSRQLEPLTRQHGVTIIVERHEAGKMYPSTPENPVAPRLKSEKRLTIEILPLKHRINRALRQADGAVIALLRKLGLSFQYKPGQTPLTNDRRVLYIQSAEQPLAPDLQQLVPHENSSR